MIKKKKTPRVISRCVKHNANILNITIFFSFFKKKKNSVRRQRGLYYAWHSDSITWEDLSIRLGFRGPGFKRILTIRLYFERIKEEEKNTKYANNNR